MEIPKKILVRAPNWIGDQVLAYPFFHFLREAYPKAFIAVACVPWVQALQFKNLVDEVFVLPIPLEKSFKARFETLEAGAQMFRKMGPWDLGISLPQSFSSAWFLYRSGARIRRGYRGDTRSFLLNQVIEYKKDEVVHRAESYARLVTEAPKQRLLATEFWGSEPDNDLDPREPGILDSFDARQSWPDAEPVAPPQGPYWVLAPGSMAESRRWPIERFAALARKISDSTGFPGVIVGGASEAALATTLSDDSSLNLSDWTARGTVAAYWQVFQNARFTVSNDSGLAHVASLCSSPVQVIWGAGHPGRTKPIGPGISQLHFHVVECWPCEKNTCFQPPERRLQCLTGITTEAIWEEINSGILKPKKRFSTTESAHFSP